MPEPKPPSPRLIDRLMPKDGFLRPVATLATGTLIAQGLVYASRPVLTRLYTQEEFGIFAFVMAIVAMLTPLASARYEDAMMLPRRHSDALNLFALSAAIVAAVSLASCVLWIFRMDIAALFDTPELAGWMLAVPVFLLVMSLTKVSEGWHTRMKVFRAVSAGRVTHGTTASVLQIVLGFAGAGAAGLFAGYAAGYAAALLLLGIWMARGAAPLWRDASLREMRRLAYRYRDFARFSTPASFLNAASSNLPKLLLLFFFAPEVVGLFWLAFGMLAVPAGLIGTSVGQVFFVRAAEARPEGSLPALVQMVFRRLSFIGLFPSLALMVAGPDVFAVVFGEGWRVSGVYAQYIALWIFFASVAAPLTRIFDVLEKQRADLAFSVIMFIVQSGALIAGGVTGNEQLAILLFGVFGALMRFLHIGWMIHLSGLSINLATRELVSITAASLPLLAALAVVTHFFGPVVVTASFAMSLALYVAIGLRFRVLR